MKQSILGTITFVVLALGILWIIQGNEFFMMKAFAPAQEEVRRETFEQSKAYKDGTIQELQNLQLEYLEANTEHRAAIADIILHRSAGFPEQEMPQALRVFVQELKQRRLSTNFK